MKKIILSLVLLVLSSFNCGCQHQESPLSSPTPNEDQVNSRQMTEDITSAFYDALSDSSKEWVASNDGIKSCINDNSISVTIRVIAPEMIARVADESCMPIINFIETSGFSEYEVSFRYYTESNQDGMDADSLVDWSTENGETGTFIDSNVKFANTKSTIEDIYKYYGDFAYGTEP